MIGKIVSTMAGRKIAARTPGLSEGQGALIGLAAVTLMRRMGPMGFIAAAGGGWVVSRLMKKRQAPTGTAGL